MSVTTRCKGCDLELSAEDEEALVAQVQAHIAEVHAQGHTPSRDQVLAVIRRRAAGSA